MLTTPPFVTSDDLR